jgi:hypothetical protein
MGARSESQDFAALKLALQVYAQARAALPPEARTPAAQELGELLVRIVGLAEQLQVDLVRAAEDHITDKAGKLPRLVPAASPDDAKPR